MTTPDNAGDTLNFEQVSSEAAHRRRTFLLSGVAVLLSAAVIVATLVLVVTRHDSNRTPEVTLAAQSSVGANPFAAVTNRSSARASRFNLSSLTSSDGARVVNGTAPGLYGASGRESCDPAGLARSLGADPARANAWAGVFGLDPRQIPYYLNTLTPVTLTADTWVTNHSFLNGVANPFQSVLQSGTAVLVDSEGVPRVRCSCGNPLRPRASAPLAAFRSVGAPWPGYTVRDVVYVQTHDASASSAEPSSTGPSGATGAAPASLSVRDPATGGLISQVLGDLLDLTSLPPLQGSLPTAVSLNVPFGSTDADVAAANGVSATSAPSVGGPETALPAEQRAVESPPGVAPTQPQAASPAPSAPIDVAMPPAPTPATESAPAPGSAPIVTTVPPNAPEPSAADPSTPAAVRTEFSGVGTTISSFRYASTGGAQVTCTVPSGPTTPASTEVPVPPTQTQTTEATPAETTPTQTSPSVTETAPPSPVAPTGPALVSCSDGTTVLVDSAALTSSAVQSATDPTTGVWRLATVSSGVLSIIAAQYASS